MKKLSRILIALAIVAAAFLGVNSSDRTTSDMLSFELAKASVNEGTLVFCQYDPTDLCKLSTNITVPDCDEVWWAAEYDLRCAPNQDPF
jgi:hypothetical protein